MDELVAQNTPDIIGQSIRQHQLLAILQLMASDVCLGRINDRVLAECLDHIALGGSRANIRNALNTLEELGLLRTQVAEEYLVATITEQGERVAAGKAQVEGIAKFVRE